MTDLESSETILIGKWERRAGLVYADSVCERIEWLTNHPLKYLADESGWDKLFVDPRTRSAPE